MNWLLTIVFYFFLFFQYYLSGDFMLSVFKYEKTFGKILISGFLTTFLITFLVGFPCQLFFTSFNTYFIIQSIVFILLDAFLLFKYKDKIKIYVKNKEYKKINIKIFIKENWLCILFVLLFTSFSMSNQLPIYQMNYDDMYYIGKVENLKTAEHLMDTDFFNGRLLDELSLSLERVLNTYELSYAYFSTIFHIPSTFFCRATMVLHNYFLFAIATKLLAAYIVDKKYTQYTLLPFFLFLIPFGYLQSGLPFPLKVNSYDLWQFQTAAFYGSSIVRMISIPVLYSYSEPLLNKFKFKKIIYLFLVSLSFISFSTIYVQELIIFFIVILFIKICVLLYNSIKNKEYLKIVLYSLLILFYILSLIATKYIDHVDFIKTNSFVDNYNSFMAFVNNWYKADIILRLGIFLVIPGIFFTKSWKKRIVYFLGIGLFILIKNGFFAELLTITSFGYFFVALRTISSIQYLILMLCGCTFIALFERLKGNRFMIDGISIVSVFSILLLFVLGQNVFIKYSYLGSGISGDGWNFRRVIDINTAMTTDIFKEVGNYFNTLPGEVYKLYCPMLFYTDGIQSSDHGFVMSSSKIQIQDRGGFDVLNADELLYLNDFSLYGQGELSVVKSLIEKEDISYILLFNETSKSYFEDNQIVLENTKNENPWFLIKIN